MVAALSRVAEKHRLARLTRHGELVLLRNAPTITIGAARVTLPPGSFLQATSAGEETLAKLVAEHCGGKPQEVSAAVRESGSLIAAAERLSQNGHSLRSVDDGEPQPGDITTYLESVADPEQPIRADAFLEAVFGV